MSNQLEKLAASNSYTSIQMTKTSGTNYQTVVEKGPAPEQTPNQMKAIRKSPENSKNLDAPFNSNPNVVNMSGSGDHSKLP